MKKLKRVEQQLETKSLKKKPEYSLLKNVPKRLPSLSRAYFMTKIVSRVGFDWPDISGILDKLDEEMKEFREALNLQDRKRICEEIGDLLFVLANIARFLRIDPEEALNKTLEKFTERFNYIETKLRQEGKTLRESNLIEMDRLWEEAKKKDN